MSARTKDLCSCAILVALALAIYARTFRHDFVSIDTYTYITGNPVVLRGLTWDGVAWAFRETRHAANWHPLTWISHMVDVSLFGLRPAGHHAVNVAIHAANACLVYALLVRTTGARAASWFAAALFVAHPLRVESVAWVVERKDVLSTFLGLASLHAWLGFARDGRRGSYAAALALFALGLLAKPMLVTWPCVMLVLDAWPLRRLARGARALVAEKLPFFLLAAASAWITVVAQRAGGAVNPLERLPLGPRLENAVGSYGEYLRKFAWPDDLAFFYPHAHDRLTVARLVAGIAGLLVVTVAALAWRKRAPAVLCGWLLFLGTLVPVIGIVQVGGQALADRYSYVPSIGLSIAIAFGVRELLVARPVLLQPVRAIAVAWIAVLGVLAWRQAGTWRDSETLARHAIDVTGGNYKAQHMLGYALASQDAYEEALEHLREALRLEPGDADARDTLATTLTRLERFEEAERELRLLLRNVPAHPNANEHLGTLLHLTNRTVEALPYLERAARSHPHDGRLATYLGESLEHSGRSDEARAQWERALALDPRDTRASVDLCRSWLESGDVDAAERALAFALRVSPDVPQVQQQLGRLAFARGDEGAAARAFSRASELRPNWPLPLADLARLHAVARTQSLRSSEKAESLARAALEKGGADPDAEVLEALATVRAAQGRLEDARTLLARALARARADGRVRAIARLEAASNAASNAR